MSRLPAAAVAAVLLLSGCSASQTARTGSAGTGDTDPLAVSVGFYPYQFVTERVGGADVDVTNLTKAGGEPHDLELTAQQVAGVGEADLVVYSAGFQPAVDEAVEQHAADKALDVLSVVELREASGDPADEGHEDEHATDEHATDEHATDEHATDEHAADEHAADEHGAGGSQDPHVWLDPVRLATIGTAVADRLAELDPAHAADYRSRAADLEGELDALDDELRAGLASCARKQLVTSHDAFGYLAQAYGLEQIALTGLSPEAEASPRRLAEIAAQAKKDGVTTIFFEELVSPKVAQSLAREVGAKATVLSPLEGAPESGDYLTAMRANLATLRTALDCR